MAVCCTVGWPIPAVQPGHLPDSKVHLFVPLRSEGALLCGPERTCSRCSQVQSVSQSALLSGGSHSGTVTSWRAGCSCCAVQVAMQWWRPTGGGMKLHSLLTGSGWRWGVSVMLRLF